MQLETLNICVCSESDEVNPLKSVISGVKDHNFDLTVSKFEELVVDQQDIVMFYLNKLTPAFLESLEKVKSIPQLKVIIMMDGDDIQLVSSLAKMGLNDIFVLPYELYKFHSYFEELLQTQQSKKVVYEQATGLNESMLSFIGSFDGIENILSLAGKASQNPGLNVLLLGDTGTGKSILAKLIHSMGEKRSAPFIEVICTAIPENLLESELFGYEKGAFTDAKNRKVGLFELANGGTIFLDEIGDLSMNLQAKLLRVTENKVIRRLGGIKDIPINTRIITATNRNLEKQIAKNLFRNDLYYRLNMITITLPALIERNDDIMILAEHFVKEFSELYGKEVNCISNQALQIIRNYKWPGNVRELRNIIERAVLLSESSVLDEQYFFNLKKDHDQLLYKNIMANNKEIKEEGKNYSAWSNDLDDGVMVLKLNYKDTSLMDMNKMYAKTILEKLSGNKTKTSKLLGISRPTLDTLLN